MFQLAQLPSISCIFYNAFVIGLMKRDISHLQKYEWQKSLENWVFYQITKGFVFSQSSMGFSYLMKNLNTIYIFGT